MPRKTPSGAALAFVDVAVAYTGPGCLLWPFNRTEQGYGIVGYKPWGFCCGAPGVPCPMDNADSTGISEGGR